MDIEKYKRPIDRLLAMFSIFVMVMLGKVRTSS